MLLKRHYKTPDGWVKEVDAQGRCTNPPPLDFVALRHTGHSAAQNFPVQEIEKYTAEGWCREEGEKLILDVRPEALVYSISRRPGRWCCHCAEKLADDAKGAQARMHVAQHHAGVESPDKLHPAGYVWLQHYECVLDEEQHELYKGEAGAVMTAGWLGRRILARRALRAAGGLAMALLCLGLMFFTSVPADVLVAGNIVFNIGLGRIVQWYINIDTNSPANSAFIICVIDAGATTDATFKDHDALSNVLAASTERTTNGWTRKTITDVDLTAWAPDDTNDRTDLVFPDQTWTAVAGAGGASTDVVVSYDTDTTGGADSAVEPGTLHDFAITPDGSDVILDVPASGFLRVT